MLQKSFSVHILWYLNLFPLLLPSKIAQKANDSTLIGPLSSSSAEEATLRGDSSCLSAPPRAICWQSWCLWLGSHASCSLSRDASILPLMISHPPTSWPLRVYMAAGRTLRERERKCGRSPKDWAQLSYSIMANTPVSQSKLRESQDEGRRKTGSSLEVRSCKART